ncbi:MAG: helix-turn-helix domain-containing protein [Oscillospiraceae bacterium]|jgi:hypothetical protein|nr:helix-turn-helix domain-containing protein [Oscillospiraceae bacterium]
MAVFRVEKNRDYTVMCNHHLRNRELSLKAKGLLSQMLSLPDNWDYTLKGLALINRENVSAIRTAVNELEEAGYIVRRQGRDDRGKMAANVYTIYEQPQKPDQPLCDFPTTDNPTAGKPITGKPTSDYRTQLNTNKSNTQKSITDISNIHQSIPPTAADEKDRMDARTVYEQIIKDNVEYDCLLGQYDREQLDEIVGLILDTVCSGKKTIRVGGEDKPLAVVQSIFLKLDSSHVEYVIDCLRRNTTKVRNIRSYLITALYNARFTMDSYYRAEVNHDMYGSGDFWAAKEE